MLKVVELEKRYRKVVAVDNVSFEVNRGNVAVLLGPNGAGKSTIIKSIVGLLRFKGQIYIAGIESKSVEAKKRMSYVPEVASMFSLLTVKEHLIYFQKAYGLDNNEEYMNELLERFDLLNKQDKMGNELSKGMMQKVSICCALIVKPDLVIFDEPMVGLDPKAIKELRSIILELRDQQKAILLSTHMLEMVNNLWDQVILMDKGHLQGTYAKADMAQQDLEEIFFAKTGVDNE
ncbi:MAG: ABC transporter ATP-binding protein [Erysipelotrichaceae bacterium]|nr:ABC transporter ATP-binding protein [Erysipelotrichaceae bacterium]MDD3924916.1 ABC transporter ATP-binding protein [Erysipelotrichaceae bacterium]MDD4642274.1 ABC transporter ATP-binding protein [Erysipelotrichaceae bacterium]